MDRSDSQPVSRQDLVQALRDSYEIVLEADIPERFESTAFELVLQELLDYEAE
jgi:hypothetical protein